MVLDYTYASLICEFDLVQGWWCKYISFMACTVISKINSIKKILKIITLSMIL